MDRAFSVILQPSFTQTSNHHPFIPEDLGLFSSAATDASSYAYSNVNGFVYPTGWLVWLVYDASEVASDDATVEVITTDGQHISVPYDLSSLRWLRFASEDHRSWSRPTASDRALRSLTKKTPSSGRVRAARRRILTLPLRNKFAKVYAIG
jgi:hypothetical protein